jgi:hypothetical protein
MFINNINSWGQLITSVIEVFAVIYAGAKFFVKLNARLDKLEEQYRPNGGSSMRDAINRIELKVTKLEGKFEQHVEETEE